MSGLSAAPWHSSASGRLDVRGCASASICFPASWDRGAEQLLRDFGGGDLGFVDLEVDESLLPLLTGKIPGNLEAICNTGAGLIIDHYGRTLGAMNLLRHDLVSGVKIDKSLTHELATNMRVRIMFSAIAELGKSLGISVAAEGVEDTFQQTFVTNAGCDIIQGNGLCLPLTAAAFGELLSSEKETSLLAAQ